jgi:hypothetical protein
LSKQAQAKAIQFLEERKLFMETTELMEAGKVTESLDKPSLAHRYLVGCRTIETWEAHGIVAGQLVNHKWMFDPQDCDDWLFRCSNSSNQAKAAQHTISGNGSAGKCKDKQPAPAKRKADGQSNGKHQNGNSSK